MNNRYRIAWLCVLGLLAGLAGANQSPLWNTTTPPLSGLTMVNAYNSAIDSINTCNSGNSAPTNQLSGVPSTGNCWLDTSSLPIKWRIFDGTSWLTVAYMDQTNHVWVPVVGGGSVNSIASAATTDLCNTTNGQPAFVSITGTIGITSFGSSCVVGQFKWMTFPGVAGIGPTLTHNATSLILPNNGGNITTTTGDIIGAVYLGGGNWRVTVWTKASGGAVDVQVFTSTQTWTAKGGIAYVNVKMCGAGGGGGGGGRNIQTNVVTGGGGGGGGYCQDVTYRAVDVPSSLTITIGTGGTAGTGAAANGTTGGDGGQGGSSTFGSLLTATGGGGGGGGNFTTNNSGTGGGGGGPTTAGTSAVTITAGISELESAAIAATTNTSPAHCSGASGNNNNPGGNNPAAYACAGGGGGGGESSSTGAQNSGPGSASTNSGPGGGAGGSNNAGAPPVGKAGGAGGRGYGCTVAASGGAAGTNNGGSGTTDGTTYHPGCGGGGGGGTNANLSSGGTGANGNGCATGGGGGGSSVNAAAASGGRGGDGCAIVTSW